jgi:hypothetical protein
MEHVMSKIVELNLAQTKTIVGGAAMTTSVVVTKAQAASVHIPVSLPMSSQVSQTTAKRYDLG